MAEKGIKTVKTAKTQDKPEKATPYAERCGPLIQQLYMMMARKGHNLRQLADYVGVSYPHATALMSGDRWWAGTDRAVIEAVAQYLEQSVLQVYFWAGFLQSGDQHFADTLATRADLVFERAKADPYTAAICGSDADWKATPLSIRSMVTILLEVVNLRTALDHAENEKSLPNRRAIKKFRSERGLG